MRDRTGPIYEVTLRVADDAAEGLDDWLALHVGDMLQLDGFDDADISRLSDADGWQTRVVRYYLDSDAALQAYLAGPATTMRQATANRFGDRFEASRRTLYPGLHPATAPVPHCLNCDGVLTGQYCGTCGQRADSRLISIWELFKDSFADLFDVDSRVWRTLSKLAMRPGVLTRDYLQGRRARYLPPFRTYLIFSLVFFIIAFFDPREQFSVLFEPGDDVAEVQKDREARQQARREVFDELAKEGIVIAPAAPEADERGVSVTMNGEQFDADCELEGFDAAELPAWLGRRLTRDRLQTVCNRMFGEGGVGVSGFFDRLLESVPVGLFVLLPIMALVLKALYPLSKRFYVEHLLFVLNYHAFVFLALTTEVLLGRVGGLLPVPGWISGILGLAIAVYVPVYLYKAMRRVYGQGHLMTVPKFLLLMMAYWLGLALMFASVAVFVAFSI